MKRLILGVTCLVWSFAANTSAATIYFKDGKTLEGQIVERTDKALKINVQGVALTYYLDEVDRVDGETVSNAIPGAAQSYPTQAPPGLQPLPSLAGGNVPQPTADSSMASTGKQGLILALIDASGAREQMNQIFSQIIAQASPEDAQKVREIINVDEMIARLVPVYEKYFSEEELRGLAAFYQSPLGRKLMMATPIVVEESMQASMAYLQERLQIQLPAQGGDGQPPNSTP